MNFLRALDEKRRVIVFSPLTLKAVAMVTMLIDHASLVLIQKGKLYGYDYALYQNAIALPEAKQWLILYRIGRMIGRISFPLFAFLLVEGFRKTNNIFKYFVRLITLAVISEIPFNLMVFNKMLCIDLQNVIFTYIVALLLLCIIKATKDFPVVLHFIMAIVAAVVCYLLKTDYWLEGILLAFVFYIFRHDLNLKCLFAFIITFALSIDKNFGFAALSVPFIYFYDGRRGYIDIKKFAYLFYPIHMFILYLIVYISYI